MPLRLRIRTKLSLWLLGAMALTVAIALGISLYVLTRFSEREMDRGLAEAVQSVRMILDLRQQAALGHTEALAGRDDVREAITARDRGGLIRIGQRVMQESGLDYILMTDSRGIVLARAHAPEQFGDDGSAIPSVRAALHGLPVATIRRAPVVSLGASGAAPVYERIPPYRLLGAAVAGFALDEQFVGDLKKTIGHEVSVILDEARSYSTLSGAGPVDRVALAATAAGEMRVARVRSGDEVYRAAYGPLQGRASSTPIGYFEVARPEAAIRAARFEIIRVVSFSVGGGALVILVAAVWLASRLSRPLSRLTLAAKALGGGDLSQRVDVQSGDEIQLLGTTFNQMATDIQQREVERTLAEEALRQSEARFRRAFEDASIGMCLTGADGRFIRVNAALCKMLGYSQDELTSKPFQEVTHPDDVEPSRRWVKALLAGESVSYQIEKRYLRKDGSTVGALVTTSLLRDADGAPLHFITQIQDITERKRAEEALRESEARIRRIFEQASDGIFLISSENRYLDANLRGLEMLGYTREELLRMGVADVLVPQERPRLDTEPALMMAGQPHLAEWVHLREDGSTFVAEVSARRLNDQSYLAIVRDLTERKRAEEALREVTQKLNSTVNNLSGFVYRCANEPDWPTEFVSQGVFDLLGYPAEEFMSGKRSFASHIERADRDRVWMEVQAAVEARRPYVLEYRVGTATGQERWVWEKGAGVFDGSALVALEGFVTDITERKRAEEQIGQQVDELRRWYRVTLGRENRVTELKREVNDLLTQAGQPPRYPSQGGTDEC